MGDFGIPDTGLEQGRRNEVPPFSPTTVGTPRRDDLRTDGGDRNFQEYIDRNDAELKRLHAIMHMATSAAPNIDLAIEETRRTPFRERISGMKLSIVGKMKFPEYSGKSDPKAHIRAFRLAISRAHLNNDEKQAGYCRFFAENLAGSALEWFAGLEENSIDNFTQLVSAFLKQYSVFIETRTTEADLWKLKQASFEPLRAYINKFREIKAKIANLNDGVALAALKNGVWFSSKFKEEMSVRALVSLDDALHRASYFAAYEEDIANLKEQFLATKNAASKKTSATKEAPTKGQYSYAIDNFTRNKSSTFDLNKHCDFHKRKGHSTEECRAALLEKERREEEETPKRTNSLRLQKATKNPKTSSHKRSREVVGRHDLATYQQVRTIRRPGYDGDLDAKKHNNHHTNPWTPRRIRACTKKQPIKPKLTDKVSKLRKHLEEMRPYELRNRNKNSMQQPNYKLSGGKGNTSPHGERNGSPPLSTVGSYDVSISYMEGQNFATPSTQLKPTSGEPKDL
ncbi:uncharacterized protein LOC130497104 [Raphanus sativus]|uniref:Uncharacterized protein LOC130497104 n=1 Tax=Raphanus sativus TaxID=3726 RepID=A0A9W3C3K3_RAPSA|nr:uncharacterized protein LOC130497104 [Raphanus sativus]